jgi:Protein of unknown function DUF262/Protein of unknown function (DUF1524)
VLPTLIVFWASRIDSEGIMAFDTQQLTVAKLFSPSFVFEFPTYQRPYRWSVEHAGALLDDLMKACIEAGSAKPDYPYFVGSIVLTRRPQRRFAVIDGRQRLTTLFILIAVLRDMETAAPRASKLHALLHDDADDVHQHDEGYRLRLGDLDGPEFARWVAANAATNTPPSDADDVAERHRRFADVAANFRSVLERAGTDPDVPDRAKLIEFVLHHCELIAVVANSEVQGITLFQVLNGRGLDLSETDQLRSDLVSRLPETERNAAAAAWDDLDNRLGAKGVDSLLRSLAYIFAGVWVTDRQWPARLTDSIMRRGVSAFHTSDLPTYGEAMEQIARREIAFANDRTNPNHFLQTMSWLGRHEGEWSEWRTVALEMVVRAGGNETRIYDWLKALDRSMYLMLINNTKEDNRRRVCSAVITELAGGGDPVARNGSLEPAASVKSSARRKMLDPIRFFNVRGALARRVEAAMILDRGETLPPWIDTASVEHVLPQNPPRGSYWLNIFSAIEHRACLDLLGNAVLLNRAVDANIGTDTFAKKKKAYLRYRRPPPSAGVQDVCGYQDWTADSIRDRTRRVAEIMAKTWEL